ncbi:MAG TPA: amidase family protein, partial [Polyangiaceae bacterium]|nr:amidase family protein [Polyangiaceae bacterium]
GPAKNPWDTTRAPGGSSGGSAIAVAASMAPASLGSDTGGSIRQPASLCGVVGVKPSYGRVSRYGLVAFASSLDQIGPFTRDVRGSARVLEVIAGHDPRDPTSLSAPVGNYESACDRGVSGLKIGVPREYFGTGLEPQVKRAVSAAIDDLERAGASVRDIEMPHTRYGVATYYVIATAEASSNLARFDGVRFGLRVEEPGTDLATMYGSTRDAGFGAEVKRRILLGTYVLSSGYYDAYYAKAQKVRTLIRRDFERAFDAVDVIATPTSPTVAFRLGERVDDPLAMYLGDIYQLPASLAGICGISLPCRLVDPDDQLPVGLQLLAPALHEETLFAAAAAHEAAAGPFPLAPMNS